MVETISDVIYAVDAKGGVDYISPVIDSILGYSASEIVGRHFGELFAKEDRERFRGHFETIAAGTTEPGEFQVLTQSGDLRWIRLSSRAVINEGRFAGVRGVLTDITKSKHLHTSSQSNGLDI